jgi:hypothetical protein
VFVAHEDLTTLSGTIVSLLPHRYQNILANRNIDTKPDVRVPAVVVLGGRCHRCSYRHRGTGHQARVRSDLENTRIVHLRRRLAESAHPNGRGPPPGTLSRDVRHRPAGRHGGGVGQQQDALAGLRGVADPEVHAGRRGGEERCADLGDDRHVQALAGGVGEDQLAVLLSWVPSLVLECAQQLLAQVLLGVECDVERSRFLRTR